MHGKPETCRGCPLFLLGHHFVPGDGPTDAKILLLGEAPGEQEAASGKPFVGNAGKVLDRMLGRAALDRAQFRVSNVIKCRPPGNYLSGAPYEATAIAHCREHYLLPEIAALKPRVIITLGNIAMRAMTGATAITKLRGFPVKVGDAWVMPTLHPSFLLPRPGAEDSTKLTGLVILDLKRGVEIAEQGFVPVHPAYALDPTPSAALIWAVRAEQAYFAGEIQYLAWDIETPYKIDALDGDDRTDENDEILDMRILRIGFAYKPGIAMSIPWAPAYLPVIRRLLELPVPQVGWNSFAFDIPIVEAQGIRLPRPQHDGMWAWHTLHSSLPRGLQSVTSVYAPELGAWKHLATSDPARYNAIDADATLRNMLGIEAQLAERDLSGLYQRHVVDLMPILYEAGQIHGVRIDRAAQEILRKDLLHDRLRLLREAQALVSPEFYRGKIRKREPKNLKFPAIVTPIDTQERVQVCAVCGLVKPNRRHYGSAKCPEGIPLEKTLAVRSWRVVPDWAKCTDQEISDLAPILGFNPDSTPQLISYARAHAHPVGENWKTGNAQIDALHREKLIKKHGEAHPIYALTRDYKGVTKTLGTYVDGYAPDAAGKIHTIYTFAPSTGRLASRNKNLQNVSHRASNKWATRIRGTIVPATGCAFVEADSSAIEAVFVGYFMGDPDYLRLARRGIHDYVTCLELGIDFATADISALKEDPVYAEVRERNKRVVHLSNYGGTPKIMNMQYPGTFPNVAAAQRAQATYFGACPALPVWQHNICLEAHKTTYLTNPWGYRHYFYNVFRKKADGSVTYSNDAKRVMAFLPQSSAGAFMRDSLLEVGASKWRPFTPAILSIHDSICLEVPEADVEEAVEFLATLLTRPIPEMDGLRVGCDVKVGYDSWAAMKKVKSVVISS